MSEKEHIKKMIKALEIIKKNLKHGLNTKEPPLPVLSHISGQLHVYKMILRRFHGER